jgi:hypothetical protein
MKQRLMRVVLLGVVGAIGSLVQRKLQERKQGTPQTLPRHAPTSPGYPDIPNLPNDPAGKA